VCAADKLTILKLREDLCSAEETIQRLRLASQSKRSPRPEAFLSVEGARVCNVVESVPVSSLRAVEEALRQSQKCGSAASPPLFHAHPRTDGTRPFYACTRALAPRQSPRRGALRLQN
jgi:hypothetical protein